MVVDSPSSRRRSVLVLALASVSTAGLVGYAAARESNGRRTIRDRVGGRVGDDAFSADDHHGGEHHHDQHDDSATTSTTSTTAPPTTSDEHEQHDTSELPSRHPPMSGLQSR